MLKTLIMMLFISTNIYAKDGRLYELENDYKNAKSEYGEFSSQSLRQQRKLKIYGQAEHIWSTVQYQCKDELLECAGIIAYEGIMCLDAARDSLSDSCNMELSKIIGSKFVDEDFEYKGVMISKGSYFLYQPEKPNMEVVGAVLTKDFRYEGVDYKSGEVFFNINGLASANLTHDQIVDGIPFTSRMMPISFHDNGTVKSGFLAKDAKVGDYVFKALTIIQLDEKGNVWTGILANDYIISGRNFPAGSPVFSFQLKTP